MVPLQSSLTVTLPAGSGTTSNHNAFPGFQPTIEKFEDKVYNMTLAECEMLIMHGVLAGGGIAIATET